MAWLSGWDKRIKITVDASVLTDANDLTQFPLTLICKAGLAGIGDVDVSCIFDEVGANGLKIAVTTDDGETQLYVEQELWDNGNEDFVLHVSKAGWVIDSETDTDLYIYYDNDHADNTTYVGVIGSTPGQAVWRTDYYVAVQHNVDATTSTITESTAGGFNGTKKGANEPIEVVGQIGDAQDFDGSDDYIKTAEDASFNLEDFTLAALIYVTANDNTSWTRIIGKDNVEDGGARTLYVLRASSLGNTDKPEMAAFDGTNNPRATSSDAIGTGWHYIEGVRDAGTTLKLYVDGVEKASVEDTTSGVLGGTTNLHYGALWNQYTTPAEFFNGIIDEARASKVILSDAWRKAERYSVTDALLTWGSEETGTSIKTVMGVPIANIKTVNGVPIANVKSFLGVSNVS